MPPVVTSDPAYTTTSTRPDETAQPPDCGARNIGGTPVRRFCGSGAISVTVDGVNATSDHAECTLGTEALSVNGGLLVYGDRTDLGNDVYIGLQVGRAPGSANPPAVRDGTYSGLLSAKFNARSVSVAAAEVTLTSDRHRGTLRGKTANGESVTGEFRC